MRLVGFAIFPGHKDGLSTESVAEGVEAGAIFAGLRGGSGGTVLVGAGREFGLRCHGDRSFLWRLSDTTRGKGFEARKNGCY